MATKKVVEAIKKAVVPVKEVKVVKEVVPRFKCDNCEDSGRRCSACVV